MNKTDLKQIQNLVNQVINRALVPVNKKLDSHTKILSGHTQLLNSHTKKIDYLTRIIDEHTRSIANIEITVKGYVDMYKINKEKNAELDERVERVERLLDVAS